ncbi:hypothetical protein AS181_18930 [Gordonia sp. SGD-V-85]|nr:hypothetical protein AS181_18930 [Gordonia sp. SGD-V-85]
MDVAELFAEVRDSLADVFASSGPRMRSRRRWPARADALFDSFALILPPVELLERLSVEPG